MKRLLIALAACVGLCTGAGAAQNGYKTHQQGAPAAADRSVDADVVARPAVLDLKSYSAMVVRQDDGRPLFAKNMDAVVPIASITKLMTAMVVLDSQLPLAESITISTADMDEIKGTRSRLKVGTRLARGELLRLALMASENRAAAALARAYPGGTRAFVAAMNHKAMDLGMYRSRFFDGTGLSSDNVSTARDLAAMVKGAYDYPLIREYTTQPAYAVKLADGRILQYRNSNGLVRNPEWDIGLSKTGYISEAGRCLVMQTVISATPVIIVLLDSWGRLTRIGDATRIRKWIEGRGLRQAAGRPES
ncbi:MAG: D-alanyl-D-alanine endopeptidase [Betaproteobacteria bacterium]|nr:D-alanyl-D-alanine endopeptidase [Betaproteobacteria bacterium]